MHTACLNRFGRRQLETRANTKGASILNQRHDSSTTSSLQFEISESFVGFPRSLAFLCSNFKPWPGIRPVWVSSSLETASKARRLHRGNLVFFHLVWKIPNHAVHPKPLEIERPPQFKETQKGQPTSRNQMGSRAPQSHLAGKTLPSTTPTTGSWAEKAKKVGQDMLKARCFGMGTQPTSSGLKASGCGDWAIGDSW